MRFILSLAVAVAALAGAAPALACTCAGNLSFAEVARRGVVVIRASVVAHKMVRRGYRPDLPSHMEVRVLDVMKGVVPGNHILVAGDLGDLCRPYVTQFPTGTEWYFVLSPLAALTEGLPEFAISVCGTHWRRVNDETRARDEAEVRKAIE